MSKVHHLTSPFSEEIIRSLHAGDTVYFDGPLFGIRDLTQIHIFDQKGSYQMQWKSLFRRA